MTPMPNHLSTLKNHSTKAQKPHEIVWRTHSTTGVWRRKRKKVVRKPHQQGCGEEKSSVGKDRRKKEEQHQRNI